MPACLRFQILMEYLIHKICTVDLFWFKQDSSRVWSSYLTGTLNFDVWQFVIMTTENKALLVGCLPNSLAEPSAFRTGFAGSDFLLVNDKGLSARSCEGGDCLSGFHPEIRNVRIRYLHGNGLHQVPSMSTFRSLTVEEFTLGHLINAVYLQVAYPFLSCAVDSCFSGCVTRVAQCFFQWIFCTTAVTIVSGGVAERAKTGRSLLKQTWNNVQNGQRNNTTN